MINRQNSIYTCKISGIDGKSSGSTLFFTSEVANYRCLYLVLDLTTVSGLVTASTVSVGTNASSYNNLLSGTLLTALSSASSSIVIPMTGVAPDIAGATNIYLNVSGLAIATTYTFNATLVGFYDV